MTRFLCPNGNAGNMRIGFAYVNPAACGDARLRFEEAELQSIQSANNPMARPNSGRHFTLPLVFQNRTQHQQREKFMRKRTNRRTSSSRSTVARSSRARGESRRQGSRGQFSEYESGSQENELHELFLDELADIYNGEQQLTKALPKMAKAAQNEELREAFEEHLQ